MACCAGQTSAGPSGKQSQQAVEADLNAEGVKAAKGKRAASAHEDDSQVQGLWCMTERLVATVFEISCVLSRFLARSSLWPSHAWSWCKHVHASIAYLACNPAGNRSVTPICHAVYALLHKMHTWHASANPTPPVYKTRKGKTCIATQCHASPG